MSNAHLAKAEDEIVKLLGDAVAKKWGAIPPFAQDEILDKAYEIEGSPTGIDVRETLRSFLERKPRKTPLE